MLHSELKRLVKDIKADEKKWKKKDALLAEARLERQRLAQSPPTMDDLGGVHAIVPDMTPEELEVCRLYHSLLVACFDKAILLRERIEEPADGEKQQFQKSFEEFGAKCWTTIDERCRASVPGVYFQIMLPYVHSLMKLLKQRKQIKPTKKAVSRTPKDHGPPLAAIAGD